MMRAALQRFTRGNINNRGKTRLWSLLGQRHLVLLGVSGYMAFSVSGTREVSGIISMYNKYGLFWVCGKSWQWDGKS